jgi:hypothetical protein
MIREFIQTPRDETINDAAGFAGIEPERLAAAINIYEQHLSRTPDTSAVELEAAYREGFNDARAGWRHERDPMYHDADSGWQDSETKAGVTLQTSSAVELVRMMHSGLCEAIMSHDNLYMAHFNDKRGCDHDLAIIPAKRALIEAEQWLKEVGD